MFSPAMPSSFINLYLAIVFIFGGRMANNYEVENVKHVKHKLGEMMKCLPTKSWCFIRQQLEDDCR